MHEKMSPQGGLLFLAPFPVGDPCRVQDGLGEPFAGALDMSRPGGKGSEQPGPLFGDGNNAGGVPLIRASELREGPAADHVARLQVDVTGQNFQPDPVSGSWKIAASQSAGRFHSPPGNSVLTPECSVFPASAVKLEHDLLGRVGRVNSNPCKQAVACGDSQAGVRPLKEVLPKSVGGPKRGPFSTVWRM